MAQSLQKLGWLLVILMMASSVLFYGSQSRIPQVYTVPVERGPAERVLSIVGRVTPKYEIRVRAEQPGQIIQLLKDEGEVVSAGEIIAQVAAEEEIATLSAARAETRALSVELERARSQLKRTANLVRDGYVSDQNLDDVEAEVDTLQARLIAAEAAERQFEVRAEKFVIRAPIDGRILARDVDPGQVVSTDTTLFEIGSPTLEVRAEADEYYADALQVGQSARVKAAGGEAVYDAVVTEISPQVIAATGGRLVRLDTAATEELPPGRTIYASIVIEQLPDAVTVPRTALRLSGGRYQAIVVQDERVRAVPVEVLDWPGARAIIRAGLEGGEQIVATPSSMQDGDRVRVIETSGEQEP